MESLYSEIREYLLLREDLDGQNFSFINLEDYVENYNSFLETLVPPSVPLHMRKYINTAHMIFDLYQDEEIEIFRFDPIDDNETIGSSSDLSEPDHTQGFINGVKLLDDYDIREQITANEFTGGFWDGRIHWVLNIKKLIRAIMSH
jgi:hypothetical protein